MPQVQNTRYISLNDYEFATLLLYYKIRLSNYLKNVISPCAGHFIQHCPTNGDPNFDIKRVKPPTGIPKSMLMATPDGSYALPSGAVAVLKPNEYVALFALHDTVFLEFGNSCAYMN